MYLLYYQPKIDCRSGKVTSCEALIRLKKDGRILPPRDFLPEAEKNGSIVDIDRWVIEKVIQDARTIFTKTFEEKIVVSFNISALSFSQEDFYKDIRKIIDKTRDFNHLFEIEMTETGLIHKKCRAISIINDLREQEIKIALDDFGTGYASLALFREFPIDTIKIDKCFIDYIITDMKTRKILEAIIFLARNLGLKTVAEGVETLEQVEMLTGMGCTELQGYYYSKPMPIEKFIIYVLSINKPSKKNKFIQWSKEYSTDVNALDSQHFILVNLLNELHRVLRSKEEREQANIQDYISIVKEFTDTHFRAEERIMRKLGYPEINEHLEKHESFLQNFKKFQEHLTHKKERDIFDLFMMIKEWFIEHEVNDDKKLGKFVRDKLRIPV